MAFIAPLLAGAVGIGAGVAPGAAVMAAFPTGGGGIPLPDYIAGKAADASKSLSNPIQVPTQPAVPETKISYLEYLQSINSPMASVIAQLVASGANIPNYTRLGTPQQFSTELSQSRISSSISNFNQYSTKLKNTLSGEDRYKQITEGPKRQIEWAYSAGSNTSTGKEFLDMFEAAGIHFRGGPDQLKQLQGQGMSISDMRTLLKRGLTANPADGALVSDRDKALQLLDNLKPTLRYADTKEVLDPNNLPADAQGHSYYIDTRTNQRADSQIAQNYLNSGINEFERTLAEQQLAAQKEATDFQQNIQNQWLRTLKRGTGTRV